ncbi:hypothetical protein [Sulfobacillus thermosulfidooxidans]|uniref:Zinc-finger domain-containing protein n=1 Tax=Sulfobacillus thermosulfidooxidans TaxID=28034 RepID=A0A2T2X4X4_SULTH|nr:hypothetical protein [Sulfobacillus thermosulfidooxidans]PSR29542.1 MAG: hypothetical protein C7B47_02150 [Sulfobacillus thermosulfidooxidans]
MNSCPLDHQWLEFLDHETTDSIDEELTVHLESCSNCRARLHDIAMLSAISAETLKEGNSQHSPGLIRPIHLPRYSLVASLLALMLIASSFFPLSRRVLASVWQTLSFHEVNAFQLTPQQINQIASQITEKGHVQIKHYGSITMTSSTHPQTSVNWRMLPKHDPAVRIWPKSWPTPRVTIQPSTRLQLTLNIPAINQLLAEEGDTTRFPASLNAVPIGITIPAITQLTTQNPQRSIAFNIAPVPELVIPSGVDMKQVIKALQGLPFLPPSVSQALSAAGNQLDSTLFLPTQTPVIHWHVQGAPAILSVFGNAYQVTWIRHGILYNLNYQEDPGSPEHLSVKQFERQMLKWFPTP